MDRIRMVRTRRLGAKERAMKIAIQAWLLDVLLGSAAGGGLFAIVYAVSA